MRFADKCFVTVDRAIIIDNLFIILTGTFELLNTFGIYNGVLKLHNGYIINNSSRTTISCRKAEYINTS